MDFVNLFIINKLSSKNGSENSVCKRNTARNNGRTASNPTPAPSPTGGGEMSPQSAT